MLNCYHETYYWMGDPAVKEKYLYRDTCEDECLQCYSCRSALKKYHMARRYHAIIDMERRWHMCERVTCKCSVEECNVI
ncbi:hypothetical protein ALC57_02649 [Trachymyrmex cornetzi]|uniref:Uncharacterized protein n=1 Tax=Trachymyrmex cornetzi TaxID=471704 RepID=A0A151JNY8_9HYME|nr:hypothetical protein ALC57_02649 [Trachymyrmex cornetzi]